jgi:histidinol-phosphatase
MIDRPTRSTVPAAWSQAGVVAKAAAAAGAAAAMAYFRRADLQVEWKSDESPVSRADREAEQAARAVIQTAFPEDGWLGEESGAEVVGTSGRRWIVDPIDGTRNFLRGIPLWSTLVACEEIIPSPQVVASAVALPVLHELYDAVRHGGARCNGTPIHVSALSRLDQSLFCYETPAWFQRYGLEQVFQQLCSRTALQRGGGDAFYHMLVASGRAELVVEPSLSIWDIAGPSLIVEEAGGQVTALHGQFDLRSGNAVISNRLVHREALEVIEQYRRSGPSPA